MFIAGIRNWQRNIVVFTVEMREVCADRQRAVLHEYLLFGVLVGFLF